MNAKEIIRILENPSDDALSSKWKVRDEASIEELIAAMHEPKTIRVTKILCELLGKRQDAKAVSVLIEALHNEDAGVRSEVAQALAQIGSPLAGEPLLAQYLKEKDEEVKDWQVIALGAVQYRPAIPYLIQALHHDRLRSYAALALAELQAKEAIPMIQEALAHEKDEYEQKLINQALQKLNS